MNIKKTTLATGVLVLATAATGIGATVGASAAPAAPARPTVHRIGSFESGPWLPDVSSHSSDKFRYVRVDSNCFVEVHASNGSASLAPASGC